MEPFTSTRDEGWYEPLDLPYIRDMADKVLGPIIDHWFRPRFVGLEKLPTRGPLILAANHSGNALPHDAVVLDATNLGVDESLLTGESVPVRKVAWDGVASSGMRW